MGPPGRGAAQAAVAGGTGSQGSQPGEGSWSWSLLGLARLPQAFHVVFEKAIQKTAPADEVRQRVINLTDEITYSVYMYTARGLFERDKLIFLAQVAFQVPPRRSSPSGGQTAAPAPGSLWDGEPPRGGTRHPFG